MKGNIISDDITEVELHEEHGIAWNQVIELWFVLSLDKFSSFRREKHPAGQLPKYSMEKIGIKAPLKWMKIDIDLYNKIANPF
jgi:hypothetical protein